jgi:predicted transcriptional regulator
MLPNVSELRSKRKRLGMTQSQLAKKTGLSRSSITKLENGHYKLSYEKVKKLFDYLENEEFIRIKNYKIGSVTLGEIDHHGYTSCNAQELVHSVWALMLETDFSQLVIKNKGEIVGSISERRINRALIEYGPDKANSLPVKEIMESSFPCLDVNIPVASVIPLLQKVQAILTVENNQIIGIITNSDINKAYYPS